MKKSGRRYGDPGWQIGHTQKGKHGRRWFVTPDRPPTDPEPELPLEHTAGATEEEEERF